MKANWIAAALVVVVLIGIWFAAGHAESYQICNEKRRMRYVQGEVEWFNALNRAEKRRFTVTDREYTKERNAAYDVRARALEVTLAERC